MAKGADILFDDRFLAYFGAQEGAFSVVTDTEAEDGQVTLTDQEKRIAIEHFGEDFLDKYRGNKGSIFEKSLDPYREFKHFPTGEIVRPGLYYPKIAKNELRLYFSIRHSRYLLVNTGGFFCATANLGCVVLVLHSKMQSRQVKLVGPVEQRPLNRKVTIFRIWLIVLHLGKSKA